MQNEKIWAVIAAGGSSQRMGENKLFIEIGGLPVLARSISAFNCRSDIEGIVIVANEDFRTEVEALVKKYGYSKVKAVVAGGASRAESVANGVNACQNADYYIIHDGARPFVSQQVISNVIADAIKHKAAAAGVPVKDTIKFVDEKSFIESTPDRSRLYITQTPQMFSGEVYSEILTLAAEMGEKATDDCMLAELKGYKVCMSKGDYMNIKITTPDDVTVSRAIYEREA